MEIRIRTTKDADEISGIQDSWDSLVSRCSRNPFLLTELVKSFISLNKAGGWNPMIVTISGQKNLLGIGPLTEKRVYGLKLARFIVRPSFSPEFIICSKDRNSYASLFIDYIFNHLGCQILSLSFEGKPQDLRSLMYDFKALGIHCSSGSQMGHRVLPITSTWEEFERLKGSSFRHKFRKIERNLDKLGTWEIVYSAGREIGQEVFDRILEVERESWKETWRAKKGSEVDDVLMAIWSGLRVVTKTRSDVEWGVYFLEVEGRPIAYSLIICYAGVAYITKTSYKARYRRFYPGIYINHAAIRNLWNTGAFRLIDFLTDLQFMETWTDMVMERCVVVMSKNPFLPLVIGSLFLNDRIKKKMGGTFEKVTERFPLFTAF
jgi:hypothetical protein